MILICSAFSSQKAEEQRPSWMDTTAPVLTIEPHGKWHKSIFHITVGTNEPSLVWIAHDNAAKKQKYKRPVSITRDGTYRYYFWAEDDFGNRSTVDSMVYVLDTRPPHLTITPKPGVYRKHTIIKVSSDEPCLLYLCENRDDTTGIAVPESLFLTSEIHGFFMAVDSAGNRTISEYMSFMPDTTDFSMSIDPPEGIYRIRKQVTITAPPGMSVYYSFDPLAPPEWFGKYEDPFILPHGLTIVRCFGKSASGIMSEIRKTSYIVDTIAPRLHAVSVKGQSSDTLYLNCKESATIRYTGDGTMPGESSRLYSLPLVILHEGVSRIKAKAWDRAGNTSQVITWEYRYDSIPPLLTVQPPGGIYNKPADIRIMANESVKILYSIDSTDTGVSMVYSPGSIMLTQQGRTKLQYRGIDVAGNMSEVKTEWYTIDSKPPEIKIIVEGNIEENRFMITMTSEKSAKLYYAVNSSDPQRQSQPYTNPVQLKTGDVLSYYGIDSAGNSTIMLTMDELKQPLAEAKPAAGLYNKRLRISFSHNIAGRIWQRFLPDTLFRESPDTIVIDKEGMYTLEYFLQTETGLNSAIRRNEYFLDWSPPQVNIRTQKGIDDSVIVFFEIDENASIYYTIDGSNPLFSATAKTAGNKFQRSYDRISLKRNPEMKFAFYAEDAAGNQGALTILNIFRPHVIPNVPAGADRIHDRILSVMLQSQEGAVIHYLRNGKIPTLQSPVFTEPINLSSSDTIVAFVVDPSGYQGEPETFIYRIDLPPSPQFAVNPETLHIATDAIFDAKGTIDRESAFEKLRFRWDFDGNDTFDTDTAYLPIVKHHYKKTGVYNAVLEVTDEQMRHARFKKEIRVWEHCPADMNAAFDGNNNAFCIDKFEWPNKEGVEPEVNVSWVEAKMYCVDAGKRLCTESEWISACNNNTRSMYPYGDRYDKTRCATEEKFVVKSGSRNGCFAGGVSDMVGNAWEWVEEKNNDLTQAFGGSYKYGKDAHCSLKFEGTVASRSDETGFRCCK